MVVKSEEEFRQYFNQQAQTLPFSHFYLKAPVKKSIANNRQKAKAPFELESINEKADLLIIRSFAQDKSGMVAIIKQLKINPKANLIIDLRNNHGGTLDAAVPLAQFLSNQLFHAGIFISQNWFNQQSTYPSPTEISKFKPLQQATYEGFQKQLNEDIGMSLIIPPSGEQTFQGKVFVLTNSSTASACEPLAFCMKYYGIATLVGEKTAGEMLSADYFPLLYGYQLFVPEADYMTVNGKRLDKIGVEPNIEVESQQALNYVINKLIK